MKIESKVSLTESSFYTECQFGVDKPKLSVVIINSKHIWISCIIRTEKKFIKQGYRPDGVENVDEFYISNEIKSFG